MIRIMDKYGIEVSDKCYAVGKIGKSVNKNTKEETEVIQSPAYCTSVEGALKSLRKRMHLEALKSFEGTLEEAVKKIQSLYERFNRELEKIKF